LLVLVLVLGAMVEVAVVVVVLPFGEAAGRCPALGELTGPPGLVEPGPEGVEMTGGELPPTPELVGAVVGAVVVVVGGPTLVARTWAGVNDG
jgi:hypothetical protein